ncbi:MAG: hypothetical protein AAF125_13855, partial [Chloroflexota bacterium]
TVDLPVAAGANALDDFVSANGLSGEFVHSFSYALRGRSSCCPILWDGLNLIANFWQHSTPG